MNKILDENKIKKVIKNLKRQKKKNCSLSWCI